MSMSRNCVADPALNRTPRPPAKALARPTAAVPYPTALTNDRRRATPGKGNDSMSYHLEWATTADTSIALYRKGQEFAGYDEPITAQYGLLLGGDGGGGLIIEGTQHQLHALATRILTLITHAATTGEPPTDID